MIQFELVTHCWAERLPMYATLLRAQLSSLVVHQPNIMCQVTVCHSDTDQRTKEVVQYFKSKLLLKSIELPNPQIWRRAIGRNKAALESKAELVWFTDCDHLFFKGCLDQIWQHLNSKTFVGDPGLIWPSSYMANADKSHIDLFLQEHENHGGVVIPIIPGGQWYVHRLTRAIGGVQIVTGDFARHHGYLNGTKWQKPVDRPFPDFKDDIIFRTFALRTGNCRIEPNGLYRLRHTEVGYGQVDPENASPPVAT